MSIRQRATIAIVALTTFGAPLHAQGRATVRGTVLDSTTSTPLARAVVQAVLVDPSSTAMVFTAVSDSLGAYRLPPMPSGKFALGFQHDVLSVLGMDSPIWALEIESDTALVMNLAVPSGPTVAAHVCGQGDGRTGMLVGYVRDAMRGSPLAAADVVVTWTEMDFTSAKPVTAPRTVRTKVGDGGTYVACGIATDADVNVTVSAPRLRTITGTVAMPASSLLRQDFALADSGLTRGTASIAGRVTAGDSSRLSAGRALIAALGVDVEISAGRFTIAGIPAGTWRVDIRAIGYEPYSMLARADHGVSTPLEIALERRAQRLDAVSIIGKPGRELAVLSELQQRMRVSGGTAFLPGNAWLQTATFPADVVRAARGFTYKSPTLVLGRTMANGDVCKTKDDPRREEDLEKRVVVYLDGVMFPAGLEQLNNVVPMNQVLAIEAYPDVVSAPARWRTNNACAIIAVWTKR